MTLEERNAKLEEAKQLVMRGWCQRTSARDKEGFQTAIFSERACTYCVSGAISKVMGYVGKSPELGDKSPTEFFGLHLLAKEHSFQNIGNWNDEPGRTVEEVVALFDRAKELPL